MDNKALKMYRKIDSQTVSKLKDIIGDEKIVLEEEKVEDYSHDEFALSDIRKKPEVVVKPGTTKEIAELLKLANSEKIPVTPRGGATGLCGGCVPTFGGIVLSFENMNRILEIDKENLMAIVEPGVMLMDFYREVEKDGLFFPPHPGDETATIGGVIATNAGGSRAVKYGVFRNFVRGLEVVLPEGEIITLGGKIMKNSSGYSLLHLLIGSEGTLGVITKTTLNLLPPPQEMITLIAPYNSLNDAIRTVPEIIQHKITPMAIEFIEKDTIEVTETLLHKKWPCQVGEAHLMIVVDGSNSEEVEKICESIGEICVEHNAIDVFVADSREKQQNILDIRSQIYEALKPKTIEILDIVVPRAEIANHVVKVHEISNEYGMWLPTYGHAGDGNVHTHLMKVDVKNKSLKAAEMDGWKEKYLKVRRKLYEDAIFRGGIISGEHGVGISKKEYLPMAIEKKQIELMRQIKRSFDPNNILNPGKIFDMDYSTQITT
jgi:glycolate oxidase